MIALIHHLANIFDCADPRRRRGSGHVRIVPARPETTFRLLAAICTALVSHRICQKNRLGLL